MKPGVDRWRVTASPAGAKCDYSQVSLRAPAGGEAVSNAEMGLASLTLASTSVLRVFVSSAREPGSG